MLVILFLIEQVLSRCAFTVNCVGSDCTPYEVDTEEQIGRVDMCPMLDNSEICCNNEQNKQLQTNFQAIDATFGDAGGGCDICAANLKRFWCEYTCSPRQSSFLKTNGYTQMKDPLNANIILTVQLVDIQIKPSVACNIWESCKRTQFASQVTAMKSPGGFFNFQGEQAVGQAKQYISVGFTDDDDQTISFDSIDPCDKSYPPSEDGQVRTPEGFIISKKCSCNNCDLTCDSQQFLYEATGVLEGFSPILVLVCWGVALLFAAGMTFFRGTRGNQQVDSLIDPI